MHGSLSQFKATLQRKKERVESRDKAKFDRKVQRFKSDKSLDDFNFPKMTESEFAEFKAELIKKRKQQNLIEYLILIGVFAGLAVVMFLIFS